MDIARTYLEFSGFRRAVQYAELALTVFRGPRHRRRSNTDRATRVGCSRFIEKYPALKRSRN